jgi:hypothetical protein
MPNIKHLSKLLFLDVSYNKLLRITYINYIAILIPVFEQRHGPITIKLTNNRIPLQEALRLLCALRNIKNPVSINLQDNQLSLSDKANIKKFVININKLSNNNFTLDI